MSQRKKTPQGSAESSAPVYQRSLSTKLFLGLLGSFALLYGVVLTYHAVTPLPAEDVAEMSWLEECRQLCAKYGLVSTGNFKADAEAYLEILNTQDLSEPLEELLSDQEFQRVATEDHPLIGKPAPDFTLIDAHDQQTSLKDILRDGPVVLVFYYGYNCSHCVAQLFALQEDLDYIHELGADIVAISADSPEHTRGKYAEYGDFNFPVLSDPDYKVSEQWGVYVPKSEGQQEDLKHGTFVIDKDGTVIFANRGYQPFVDNKSLLYWIAGRNSESQSKPTAALLTVQPEVTR